jgi:hypothetical protein
MRVLLLNISIHPKNLNSLLKYGFQVTYYYNTDLEFISLEDFDVVYSPSQPIDVKKYPNSKFIFGPHFSVFPEKNHMELIEGPNSIYIQPSEWAKNVWVSNPFCKNIRLDCLPFGVEVNKFTPSKPINERNNVFVYYKRRNPDELNLLLSFLMYYGIKPQIFDYINSYSEEDYINYLKEAKFGIWLDAHESQGFALEEALSCNVPLLVWNVTSMHQEHGSSYTNIPATTIPYWDDRCGEFFYSLDELPYTYDKFINNLNNYKPREYILENISIEKCGNKFIEIVNKI